jgi:hypothetical protein
MGSLATHRHSQGLTEDKRPRGLVAAHGVCVSRAIVIGCSVCYLDCGPVVLSATAAGFSFFLGGRPGSAQPEAVLPPMAVPVLVADPNLPVGDGRWSQHAASGVGGWPNLNGA